MNIANWLDAAGLRQPKRAALFEGRQQVANYGAFVAPERLPLGCHELDREDMGALTSITSSPGTPYPRHADDLAWLFYTASSTDDAKAVMLSHGNLTAMSQDCSPDVDPFDANEAVVYAAPMSHCAGLYSLIHVRRAARHIVPESRDFKAEELFELTSGLGNITLFVAPAMFTGMVEQARRQGHDGKGIKTIIYGDAPIYPTDLRNLLLKNSYGELLKTELRLWLKASANDACTL